MKVGVVLSPLVFAIVVDVVTENAREGVFSELLYADDLVMMSESLRLSRLREEFWRGKGRLRVKDWRGRRK